jgi:glycosyltransferase involved in cell wall biosynthesis|tara:strand:- start:73 stop:288 length:216 start_codon:yes stop_codon:yes gene_type:complete
VHFFGRLPHNLLKFVFPCCDVAVFPSCIPEAYPLVLMESLANGVMPMCSDFSGFSDGLDELASLLSKDKKG